MKPRQKVRSVLRKYQKLPNARPGILGNGAGLVEDFKKPGHNYVRIGNAPPISIVNHRTAPIDNQKVWVGYDPLEPNILQVLSIRSVESLAWGGANPFTSTARHASSHRWFERDTVFVDLRQMMPFRPQVDGSMVMQVYHGIAYIGNQWQVMLDSSIDLTSYIPSTGTVYALVYYDTNGDLAVKSSIVKDLNSLIPSDAPSPIINTVPIALVRLWSGMSGIVENRIATDIADVRWMGLFGGGGGGGGGGNVTPNVPSTTYWPDGWNPSDVSPYYNLPFAPHGLIAVNTFITGSSSSYLYGFLTGFPGIDATQITAGDWIFDSWFNAQNKNARVYCYVYKRDAGGTETELFNFDYCTLPGLTGQKEFVKTLTKPAYSIDPTDRLLVKFYGTDPQNYGYISMWTGIDNTTITVPGFYTSSGTSSGGDEKLKISSADTTASYLENKLIAGSGVIFVKNNAGANETLTVSGTTLNHDHSGDVGDGGQFLLTNLLSTGQTDTTLVAHPDGAGGVAWGAGGGGGGGSVQTNITMIAPSNMAGTEPQYPNQINWKNGSISSVTLTGITYQVYSYYNTSRYVVVAVRTIPGGIWSLYTTPYQFAVDSDGHNYISVGLDPDGYIHLCYDMHGVSLRYRKSSNPISSFNGTFGNNLSMLGTNEDAVTYPGFFNDPAGNLYFTFRHDTGPGHIYGDTFFYKYNHGAGTWAAATGTGAGGILVDATNETDLAYHFAPYFDADFGSGGKMHFFWTIYAKPGNTYDNLFYMYWDGTDFHKIDGTAQTIPATTANSTSADTLSGNNKQPDILGQLVSSDSDGHPHIAYARDDGDGNYNLYHIWHNGVSWIKRKFTETPAAPNTTVCQSPIIAINRNSDTVYVAYTSHSEGDTFIRLLTSGAGDFTAWSKTIIYNRETDLSGQGIYMPKYDSVEWERTHWLMIPIEQWGTVGNQPIYLLEMSMPSPWALLDAAGNPTQHANDINTAGGIHHTLGTSATQAAAGNHTHTGVYAAASHTHDDRYYTEAEIDALLTTVSGGEVLMADGEATATPLANDEDTDWLYT